MMSIETEIFVYVDLEGKPFFVGRLWFRSRKGREGAAFEYDTAWIKNPNYFSLEPALKVGIGPHYTSHGKALFGAIGDSAPDRWGRVLMRRAERHRATIENRTPRTLTELDYLLLVTDAARQGALRFSKEAGGIFQSPPSPYSIPPLVELPCLLSASDHVADDDVSNDELRLLLAPGSSLGGSRPKASVRDCDGNLVIAKFPHKGDEIDTVRWEAAALTLAKNAGIKISEYRLEIIAGRPVLLLQRFDRIGTHRRPFLSAMSMLGANDNEQRSYLEITDALRQHGSHTKEDLRELWRRIVFNVLISNTDDHLRNHGFLYDNIGGWRLSPSYDLNPVPVDIKPRILSTSITLDDPSASLVLAMEMGDAFEINYKEAKEIAREVGQSVSCWRQAAMNHGINPREIERMKSAFEHDDLRLALKI